MSRVPGHAERGDAGAPAIRLRRLVKHYGRRTALCGIDLAVTGPQIVGVVGPDGAGKTTLLRSLAGLLAVEADEADVLGVDLRGDVTRLKEMLGYVPQVFSLYPELTVHENLSVVARLHMLDRRELERRAMPVLERTGLAPFVDRQAGKLSGGMKQKLAVTCALLPNPRILILDEPTAGVDVVARDQIWAILAERKDQVLILISTSYLEEVAACDRLVYLDEGRVVAVGSPGELCAAVPLELYRAWGDDPRAIARAARALPYVDGARATGRFARIEVWRATSPGATHVLRELGALRAAGVRLAEALPIDLESMLLALSRAGAARGSRAA
ncbi:MAG: ABC transporter ATP-binding protein [Deltaproteobacteria bacterium]|nr:ABC transporter ATP-binding protein [Deltaproteobacteria bacterium]